MKMQVINSDLSDVESALAWPNGPDGPDSKSFVCNILRASRLFSIFCTDIAGHSAHNLIVSNILTLRYIEKTFSTIPPPAPSKPIRRLCVE